MKTTLIASTLLVFSSLVLQTPEAFSQSNQTASLQLQQTTLSSGRLNRRPRKPGLSGPTIIQSPLSVVGNWSGSMNAKGDDVVTYFDLTIPSSPGVIKQGTWKRLAPNAQGLATIQRQGNQVNIKFHNYNGQTLELQGTFKNGGQTIAGYDVNHPNFIFSFSK